MDVKIIDMKLVPGDKPLRAFVVIQLGDLIVRDLRVVKENGKRPLVLPPQISWKRRDGKIQYKTVVTFPDELKGRIDFAVLKRFIAEMEKKNGSSTQ
jgi:DNA-binding cell septation regulator SpoVG